MRRETGLESTQAAVPDSFSPTIASCITMTTPTAANKPVKMLYSMPPVWAASIEPEAPASREMLSMVASKIPSIIPTQIKKWVIQVRVPNQAVSSALKKLSRPRCQPRPWRITNALLPDIASLHDLHEYIFKFIGAAAEIQHARLRLSQHHAQQLCLSSRGLVDRYDP